MAIGLSVGVYVARYLGPGQYGQLNYAIAFVGLFGAIAGMGLDNIVVRELVHFPERQHELLGTSLILKLFGFLLMLPAIGLGIQFTHNDNNSNLFIGIVALGYAFQAFNVIDLNFQARVESQYVVKIQIAAQMIIAIFQISCIWLKAPLIYFVIITSVNSILLALGLSYIYSVKYESLILWKFRFSIARKLLKDAWPLLLSGLAIMGYMRIDQVMIKNMLDNKAVGIYAAAVKLSEVWYFLPMTISSSLFPAIINARKQSEDLYLNRLQRLHNLLVFICIVIALPGSLLSLYIIRILYGEAYASAASVLGINIWAGLFVALGVASSKFLIAENLQLRTFFRTAAGMGINVILNLILIPHYGINGAAVATLVSYAFAGYFYDIFDPKCRSLFVIKTKSLFGFWRLL